MVFNHSVKLPSNYREAVKIYRKSDLEKKSLKTLIFGAKHVRIGKCVKLFTTLYNHEKQINAVIEKSGILEKNDRLDKYCCRLLVTELLFGQQMLPGESKPVTTVLAFEDEFRRILRELGSDYYVEEVKPVQIPRYVRINTLKISQEDAIQLLRSNDWRQAPSQFTSYNECLEAIQFLQSDQFIIDFHVKNLLIFPGQSRSFWARSEWVGESLFILQDKASCLPPYLLNPPPKSIVLDMCAAPGNKTTQLAALMKNKGKIYAVDHNVDRYKHLCEVIHHKSAKCIEPIKRDALTLNDRELPKVEYILVDPSCSGSGIMNRMEKTEKDPDRLYKLAGLQIKLLCHAMKNFPDAKKIVYSTCSLFAEENEEVVEVALERNPYFKLVDPRTILGENGWNNFGSDKYKNIGNNCIYSLPEKDLTNGFFVAVFEKVDDDAADIDWSKSRMKTLGNHGHDNGGGEPEFYEENGMNQEEVEETSEEPKKKKKKKSVIEEEVINETPKKKKKKSVSEEEVINEEPKKKKKKSVSEEEVIEEKPKKKTKKSTSEEVVEAIIEIEDDPPKKKKKKSKTEAIPVEIIEIEDDSREELPTEKKKKKKRSKETIEETIAETPLKKQKKHKEIVPEEEIIDLENLVKKSKKKKK